MKYCPQCKRQFDEPWLSFCSDDGTPLIQDLTPLDPNWDTGIREPKRETKVEAPPSEQETQWLPREPPLPGAWLAPDERPPMNPPVPAWQPPPPPPYRPINAAPSQGLAVASMIVAIAGIVLGSCFGPLPAITALILGIIALVQIKNTPEKVGGKPYAVAGVIISSLNIFFYIVLLIWFLVAMSFS